MNEITQEILRTLSQGSLKSQTEYCLSTVTIKTTLTTWTRPVCESGYLYESTRFEDIPIIYVLDQTDHSVWSYERRAYKVRRYRSARGPDAIAAVAPLQVTRLARQPRPASYGQRRYLSSLLGLQVDDLAGLAELAAKRSLGAILDEPLFASFSRDIVDWRQSTGDMEHQEERHVCV